MSADTPLSVIPSIEPGGDALERLEETRALVESGEVSAIAVAVVYRDGSTSRSWSRCPNTATMIGAVELLKRDLIEKHRS